MKVLLITLLLIIFLPLPLKSSIYYSKENYYIKLFNFKIVSKRKKTKINNNKERNNNTETPKTKNKSNLLQYISIKNLLSAINHNKFKPLLYCKGYITYSLPDAAKTAITYGTLSTILPIIYKLTKILFNSRKFKVNNTPVFKDVFFLEIKLKSIILISIGQIIYMFYLIIHELILEREREGEKI